MLLVRKGEVSPTPYESRLALERALSIRLKRTCVFQRPAASNPHEYGQWISYMESFQALEGEVLHDGELWAPSSSAGCVGS